MTWENWSGYFTTKIPHHNIYTLHDQKEGNSRKIYNIMIFFYMNTCSICMMFLGPIHNHMYNCRQWECIILIHRHTLSYSRQVNNLCAFEGWSIRWVVGNANGLSGKGTHLWRDTRAVVDLRIPQRKRGSCPLFDWHTQRRAANRPARVGSMLFA